MTLAWVMSLPLLPKYCYPKRPTCKSNLFTTPSCQLEPVTLNRRQFLQSILYSLVILSPPSWSYAQQEDLDYYKNILQQTVTELQVSISLLEKNRLQDFRIQIRSPPFSLLRKSCTKLYQKTTTENSERRKQAESIYHLLLRDLEKADFLALQLERNSQKKNQNQQVLVDYVESSMRQLQQFIDFISETS